MAIELLELSTRCLLEKIGAGKHIPGSGSAAALNGMIGCELLTTVINLTLDPARTNKYSYCKNEFEEIGKIIKNDIQPELEKLFEEDSKQFDKAIKKRIQRNSEPNQRERNALQKESLEELKTSTEIPIRIAKRCIQLAKLSIIVFDKGFKSARGDSGVALGNAISGLTGCISIINLNLQSFPKSNWTNSMKIERDILKNEFDFLNDENIRLMDVLENEAEIKGEFLNEFREIKESILGKFDVSHIQIEKLARRIQNSLWKYRELIWENNPPENFLAILKPEKVIKLLNYSYRPVPTLGVNEQNEEIAGILDNRNCTISVSTMYKPEVLHFTSAHELGHALLHNKLILHRDIPLDGSESERLRPIVEIQADKFAAYFLMPKKLLVDLFQEFFQADKFIINENTTSLIANSSLYIFRKKIKTKRDLSRLIAKCEYYDGNSFNSLAKMFKVSVEAMAIRLEELNLVDY